MEKVQRGGVMESTAGVTSAQGFVLLQGRARERAPDAGPVAATPAVAIAGGK